METIGLGERLSVTNLSLESNTDVLTECSSCHQGDDDWSIQSKQLVTDNLSLYLCSRRSHWKEWNQFMVPYRTPGNFKKKTFEVLWLFAKVFSVKFGGHCIIWQHQRTIHETFFIPPICKSFPLYSIEWSTSLLKTDQISDLWIVAITVDPVASSQH